MRPLSDGQRHKMRIAARFNAAAASYDDASALQYQSAQQLNAVLTRLALPQHARILEIGCGSGHLSTLLYAWLRQQNQQSHACFMVSDIAPAMLRRTCDKLKKTAHDSATALPVHALLMDGEAPALAPERCDLIVSNLAVQWFSDLTATLAHWAKLLDPNGHIIFTTFGAGSFRQWHAAHARLNLDAATPHYPDAVTLANYFPPDLTVSITPWHTSESIDPLAFLRQLRALGADTPAPGRRPLTAGQLRRVLRILTAEYGDTVDYVLLLAHAQRKDARCL